LQNTKSLWLMIAFSVITLLSIASLVVFIILQPQVTLNNEQTNAEVHTQEEGQSKQAYWTKERMENAEPVSMPQEDSETILLEIFANWIPFLFIGWIVFAYICIVLLFFQLKSLREKHANLMRELSKQKEMK